MATLVKQNFIRTCSSQPLLAQMVWFEKTPKMLGKINPPFETLEEIRYRFSNVVSRQRQPSFAFSVSLILKIRNCKIPNLLFFALFARVRAWTELFRATYGCEGIRCSFVVAVMFRFRLIVLLKYFCVLSDSPVWLFNTRSGFNYCRNAMGAIRSWVRGSLIIVCVGLW